LDAGIIVSGRTLRRSSGRRERKSPKSNVRFRLSVRRIDKGIWLLAIRFQGESSLTYTAVGRNPLVANIIRATKLIERQINLRRF